MSRIVISLLILTAISCSNTDSVDSIYQKWVQESEYYNQSHSIRGNLHSEIRHALNTEVYLELSNHIDGLIFMEEKFLKYYEGTKEYQKTHKWDAFFAFPILQGHIDPYSFDTPQEVFEYTYGFLKD